MTDFPDVPKQIYEPIHLVTIERKEMLQLTSDAARGRRRDEARYAALTLGHRQHLSIPNNWIGRVFLWALRRWMNHTSYKLTLKGRNVRRPPCTDPLPMSNAKRIGIYIDQKKRATRRIEQPRCI
jgi:hypothetical protein